MEEQNNRPAGRPRHKILRWFMLTILLLAAAMYFFIFHVNQFSVEIRLKGDAEVRLAYEEAYTEQGAELWLFADRILQEGIVLKNRQVLVEGDVLPQTLGRHEISYSAEFFGLSDKTQRIVHILDMEPPELILNEMEEEYIPGTSFLEPGYTATDNHDGDVTDRVVRTEKTGEILYAVTDFSGNPAVVKRSIPGFDPQPPTITLEGETDYRIQVGTFYEEPGYSASDDLDGDLTQTVSVDGDVDWLTAGTYPVTYTVTDSGGNTSSAVRNVTVEAVPWVDTEYPAGKTIYLTFDDGPSIHTRQLLDVLDAYGAKATFFVVDTGNGDIMKEIVRRGHSIGIHSVTHNYEEIYASPEAFFRDLYGMQEIIFQNTGVRTTLMRFPGGSSNTVSRRYCDGIMTTLTRAVQDAGFQYFDWNVNSGDAGNTSQTDQVYEFVTTGVQQHRVSVVLQHDIHYYSVAAVEKILRWGMRNGYQFLALSEHSPGFHQDVLN